MSRPQNFENTMQHFANALSITRQSFAVSVYTLDGVKLTDNLTMVGLEVLSKDNITSQPEFDELVRSFDHEAYEANCQRLIELNKPTV